MHNHKKASKLAHKLHNYFMNRTYIYNEDAEYRGCPFSIEEALKSGCRNFDGVIVFENKILGDFMNPEGFKSWFNRPSMWETKKFEEQMKKPFLEIANGTVGVKRSECNSEEIVMTSAEGSLFDRHTLYFDYLRNLPNGACYIKPM